jgi:hypothetical protein
MFIWARINMGLYGIGEFGNGHGVRSKKVKEVKENVCGH